MLDLAYNKRNINDIQFFTNQIGKDEMSANTL